MRILSNFATLALTIFLGATPTNAQPVPDPIPSVVPSASSESAPSKAVRIVVASIGFEMEYKAQEATVCVVFPTHLQDADDCKGINVKPIAEMLTRQDPSIFSMAILRYPDTAAHMMMMKIPPLGDPPLIQAHIDGFVEGTVNGVNEAMNGSGVAPTSDHPTPYDVMKINDLDVVRFYVTKAKLRGSVPLSKPRSIYHVLLGKEGLVGLSTSIEPEHEERVRKDVETMIKTARLPKAQVEGLVSRVVANRPKPPRTDPSSSPKSKVRWDYFIGLVVAFVVVGSLLWSTFAHRFQKKDQPEATVRRKK